MELGAASAETIVRRSWLMTLGRCPTGERRRMVAEKLTAASASWAMLARPEADALAMLRPWHRAARANAKRLRKRG